GKRDPQVLADLNPHHDRSRVGITLGWSFEKEVNPEGGLRETEVDLDGLIPPRGLKPAMLVEFLVSGKILLGNDPPDGTITDNDGAVEQAIADGNRGTHDDELCPASRGAGDFLDRAQTRV